MSADWNLGYVTEIDYTHGYYAELNPLRAAFALVGSAVQPPAVIETACELGFGQGLSAAMHAAAGSARWYGTDFNPAQAANARELVTASGSDAQFFDQSFEEFCSRDDLPDFDFISLHGIWSWISDANRNVIVDFVRRKLKVGGVLYLSYNTLPGWAATVPLRHLLTEHAAHLSAPGAGTVQRVDAALAYAEKLFATQPLYAKANPQVAERLKHMQGQNRQYLAHEFFNRDWHPMPFSRMAQWLSPAKLNYGGSAYFPDHIDGINLTAPQQAMLKEIADPMFAQTVRDYMVNQQFRRDYWVRGARKFSGLPQVEALRQLRFVLTVPATDVAMKIKGALGELPMQEAVYKPLLELLADHKPRTLGQIEQALQAREIKLPVLLQCLLALVGKADASLAQDDKQIAKAKPRTDRLNRHLAQRALGNGDVAFVACPVTGGAVPLPRLQQLFLYALWQGRKTPAEWVDTTWKIFVAQNMRVTKEGKRVEDADENIAELQRLAQEFADKTLPVLRALQVL